MPGRVQPYFPVANPSGYQSFGLIKHWVNEVRRPKSPRDSHNIFTCQSCHGSARFFGSRSDMGKYCYIWHGKERVCGKHWLWVGYIKARTPDKPILQGFYQIRFIVYCATCCIDKYGIPPHFAKG